MNKDVIYIEPENDITDIITKIEQSSEKIAVLVPPKKAGVFRSVVNIKLIAKAAAAAEKTVVLVTVDPSIVKLAAASRIPVTKDLKTPPTVPTLDSDLADDSETEIIDEYDPAAETDEEGDSEEIVDASTISANQDFTSDEAVENPVENSDTTDDSDDSAAAENDKKHFKNAQKAKKPAGKGLGAWIRAHKIPVIIGAVALIGIVGFLVWAFVIAPAVSVSVEVQTEAKNIAENVTFTLNPSDEDAAAGVFYIEEKKIESSKEVKFDATGKQNRGDKAGGTVKVIKQFTTADIGHAGVTIPEGAILSVNGLRFSVTKATTISPPADAVDYADICGRSTTCDKSGEVYVSATEPGTKYNVGNANNWSSSYGVTFVSSNIGGGTDNEVTVVEQIDVENAKNQLKTENETEIRDKLYGTIGENQLPIESSFSESTSNATATPGVGEEVTSGTAPVLKAVTTASMFVIDRAKMEEFIAEKAKLEDNQKIYAFSELYIENFAPTAGGYSGRLKTTYEVGPKLSESEILDQVKGKGLGDIQHDLKSLPGVVSVTIDTSYPWVNVAPGDTNKITVHLDIKTNKNQSNGSKAAKESDQ